VVRLSEGRTAYYKASFQAASSTAPAGVQTIVSSDIAPGTVQAGAWSPALDTDMLQQVLPLLQKLRARRGATGVFCPVSPATLEDTNALQGYVGLLQANPDAAAGIVLDLHHTGLAGLGEAGMRGLAWLASLGATFCLTSDKLQVNDLAALSELGFAFIDVPASTLMRAQHAGQISPAISLVQSAADSNIAIIASAIVHAADTTQLMSLSSLGRGAGFAPPRAVRDPAPDTSSRARVA
jgi:EAL domain-containing protein (putative c-di-GMP-specific phosphodiesterase class I)